MRDMLWARKHLVMLSILTFLVLVIISVGCRPEEPEPTPQIYTPVATVEGTPTITPTFQTFTAAIKATPTPTPATPTPSPISGGYRVIFLLDNSNSPLDECLTEAQDPAHSEAHRAMRDLTVFVVNVLAELSRRAPEADVKVGIYNIFALNPRDQGDPDRHKLLALQSVGDLWPGWEQRMVTSLETQVADLPGLDVGWLLPSGEDEGDSDQDSDRPAVLTGEGNDIVILITDGYTGYYPVPYPLPTVAPSATATDTPDEIREIYVEQLNTLTNIDGVGLKVLRFDCPGLTQDNSSEFQANIYQDDLEQWRSWDEDDLAQMTLDLPSTAGASESFLEAAQALLAPFEQTAIWPQNSQDGQEGAGWYNGSPAELALPANTVSLTLRVVSAAGGAASYHLRVERDGHVHRRPLSSVNPGHIYSLEPEEHGLSEIIDAPSDTCGPIIWRVEGAPAPAFYWWESAPADFSIEAEVRGAVTNNGEITAAFRVNPEVPTQRALSHLDCYTVRVSLRTTAEPNDLVAVAEFPLRELYPRLVGEHSFEGYGFAPRLHTGLVVTVELLQELDKQDGDDRFTDPQSDNRIAIAWTDVEVESRYEPYLHGWSKVEPCEGGSDGCIELRFDYANGDYFEGDRIPQPQLYALSTEEEMGSSCENYERDTDATITPAGPTSDAPQPEPTYLSGRLIPEVASAKDDQQRAWTMEDSAQVRIIRVPLTPSTIIKDCGYSGLLVQWDEKNDGTPAILCVQEMDNSVHCNDETGIRFHPDGVADSAGSDN